MCQALDRSMPTTELEDSKCLMSEPTLLVIFVRERVWVAIPSVPDPCLVQEFFRT